MEKCIDVSIVIINFFTADYIKTVISSIVEKTDNVFYEIIIVDNSESDDEFAKLKLLSKFCKVTLVKAPYNMGFGKANNLGAKYSSGRYLFFLNPDTYLVNNAIFLLKEFLDLNASTSIVGPNIFNDNLNPNHSYYLNEKNLKNERVFLKFFKKIKKVISKKRDDFNYSSKAKEVKGYVSGAALMIRTNDFIAVNGFDEDIFMYDDETFLCFKVRQQLKQKIFNVPSSKIVHLEGGSFGDASLKRQKMMLDGTAIYFLKAFGVNDCLKFLNAQKNICLIKKNIFLFNKNKKTKYNRLMNLYKKKIMEIKAL